jgi:hypothetical protein
VTIAFARLAARSGHPRPRRTSVRRADVPATAAAFAFACERERCDPRAIRAARRQRQNTRTSREGGPGGATIDEFELAAECRADRVEGGSAVVAQSPAEVVCGRHATRSRADPDVSRDSASPLTACAQRCGFRGHWADDHDSAAEPLLSCRRGPRSREAWAGSVPPIRRGPRARRLSGRARAVASGRGAAVDIPDRAGGPPLPARVQRGQHNHLPALPGHQGTSRPPRPTSVCSH